MRLRSAAVCGFLLTVLLSAGAAAFDRDALGIVVAACSVHEKLLSSPAPCSFVDGKDGGLGGFAILSEPTDRQRTILAALAPIPGIEDPRLVDADAPNFFADAWRQRGRVLDETAASDPWHGFALAINPKGARSQDRLHLHMACLRPALQTALARRVVAVNPNRFAALNFKLDRHTLWAMRTSADGLDGWSPLKMLAERMPGARDAMGERLLIVVAERLPNGEPAFVLLTNPPSRPGAPAFSVESFLDSTCR